MADNKVLTVRQVAKLLGIGYHKTLELLRNREIPAFRIGVSWRVKETDVFKYMDHKTTPTTTLLPQPPPWATAQTASPEPVFLSPPTSVPEWAVYEPEQSHSYQSQRETLAIERGYTMPQRLPRGGRNEVYPFSKLEIGESFLIPCTPSDPLPWEKHASSVSSAGIRLEGRKFALRRVEKGKVYGEGSLVESRDGCRVFRIK